MAVIKLDVKAHIANLMPIIDDQAAVKLYLDEHGIPEPKAKTEQGYKSRLLCSRWWRRTLDRLKNRDFEACQIEDGRVAKCKQIYASDGTVSRMGRQAARTQQFLKTQFMVSDDNEVVDMQTIIQHSLANPVNRRAELMIRMAGFEIYADSNGFVGEFYTITTPSKYHRYSVGAFNPKWQYTPKEAQQYLVKQWSKIRASLARDDIKLFGFRVAEPHHDGCPHWHMLLFMRPEQITDVRKTIAHYALEIDGDEKGAAPPKGVGPGEGGARFKAVAIDPEKGSATAYIAKYISKNLGFSIEDADNDVNEKSSGYGQRVKAWASVWGIRQFQQIGGAPVTVWRQLRKLDETDIQGCELLERARVAADQSQWAEFLEIMGGATAKRVDHEIKLLKKKQVDSMTGELKSNRYLEILDVIYGVTALAFEAITRKKNWIMTNTKDAIARAGATVASGGGCPPWSPVNNCTAWPDRLTA